MKYNYTFDESTKCPGTQEGVIQISSDEQELIITNHIAIQKRDEVNLDYKLGMFELQALQKKQEKINKRPKKHICKKSKASCRVADITGFIYGGMSARFWMMRKHINQLQPHDFDHLPLYAWECISVETSMRTIDLVIHSPNDMVSFITYLIHTLKTIDGQRGSGLKILKA